MTCFEFDIESALVNYLNSVVVPTSSAYPIYAGHTPVTSSEDYPKISVMCENWMNVNQAYSPKRATIVIDVMTVAYDVNAYPLHAYYSQEIEQSMNNQPYLISWVAASSSMNIAAVGGIEYKGCSCPVQGIQFLNSYTYVITAQQMVPSSSTTYC